MRENIVRARPVYRLETDGWTARLFPAERRISTSRRAAWEDAAKLEWRRRVTGAAMRQMFKRPVSLEGRGRPLKSQAGRRCDFKITLSPASRKRPRKPRIMRRFRHERARPSKPSRLSNGRRKSVRAAYREGAARVLMVAPTGSGKTIMFAFLIASAMARGKRILILGHRIEIIEQICDALAAFGVPHGVIRQDLVETDDAVQVASVASLIRRLDRWRGRFDLIVIDEAHHAVAGSWAKTIGAMIGARILGVTATPERLDGRGLGDVFQTLIEGPSVRELIEGGYLSKFTAYAPAVIADLSHVRTRAGDYAVEDLADAMGGVVIKSAVLEYARLCAGAPAVAFCVDIEHSQQVAACFRAHGYRAAHLDCETPASERRRIIAALGEGGLDVLCNCGIVSEGVDVPALGAAILLRPTQSLALHLQQCGRALRPAQGKDRALLLDFSANCERHGLPDAPRLQMVAELQPPARSTGEPGDRAALLRVRRAQPDQEPDLRGVRGRSSNAARAGGNRDAVARARGARERAVSNHVTIRDWPYSRRVAWAGRDVERLRMVATACGYQEGWIFHALREATGATEA